MGMIHWYYDLCNLEELPDLVRGMLKEPGRMYGIACRAKAEAEKLHTWEQRARALQAYI